MSQSDDGLGRVQQAVIEKDNLLGILQIQVMDYIIYLLIKLFQQLI